MLVQSPIPQMQQHNKTVDLHKSLVFTVQSSSKSIPQFPNPFQGQLQTLDSHSEEILEPSMPTPFLLS